MWGSALGGTGSVAGNGNSATFTYNAGGIATGIDYRARSALAGRLRPGLRQRQPVAGRLQRPGHQQQLPGAASTPPSPQGAFYLDGLAGYGYNDNQMTA